MDYILKRSSRRSVSIEITRDLAVLVRAPLLFPKGEIDRLVAARAAWIDEHLTRRREAIKAERQVDTVEAALRARARAELPPLVERYAAQMGLHPTSVRITSAKTRFGSCSGKNGVCFSWRLMAYPLPAVEYVVVHELAHIRHKNHGAQFHALVERYLPDHRERRALLRQPPLSIPKEETIQ